MHSNRILFASSRSRTSVKGRLPSFATGKKRPILLKKSASVSTAEKYALEIEILTLHRGFRAQISRSSVQKRRFHCSMHGRPGWADFFNRIGQKQTMDMLLMRQKCASKSFRFFSLPHVAFLARHSNQTRSYAWTRDVIRHNRRKTLPHLCRLLIVRPHTFQPCRRRDRTLILTLDNHGAPEFNGIRQP